MPLQWYVEKKCAFLQRKEKYVTRLRRSYDNFYVRYTIDSWNLLFRFYVQPQWIFDAINRRSKLNERDYALGRTVHLHTVRLYNIHSWISNSREGLASPPPPPPGNPGSVPDQNYRESHPVRSCTYTTGHLQTYRNRKCIDFNQPKNIPVSS